MCAPLLYRGACFNRSLRLVPRSLRGLSLGYRYARIGCRITNADLRVNRSMITLLCSGALPP